MGDYILRLETELKQARHTASSYLAPEQSDVSNTRVLSVQSFAPERKEKAYCRLALFSWRGKVRLLRAKRYGIVRLVTKSQRSIAVQVLGMWAQERRLNDQVNFRIHRL